MIAAPNGRNRLGAWYERTTRPGWVLTALVVLLYFPSLFGGFLLDDHHCLRVLGEFRRGERPAPDVYRFLSGGEQNRAARVAGWYPWWLSDDVRYRHLRPVCEWILYGEYLLFGDRALVFRLVGMALYALGVRLVLGVFRLLGGDEALARWAALLFAVAACHVVPVVFVSNHGDVIALVLGVGAVLAVGRFIREGGAAKLLTGAVLFGLGLFAKEAVLAMAVLPACVGIVWRGRPGVARRILVSVAVLGAGGLAWLLYYASTGSGSNALPMLDPIHAPLAYLAAMPGRAIVLLTTWLIPFNPFLLVLSHEGGRWLYVYGAAGAVLLALLAGMYGRHHRAQRGVISMALWPLPFLPLLACTVPDDRVMMLPSVGLAFLGAAWMTRPRADGSRRLRMLPFMLFIAVQVLTVPVATALVQFMEREAQRHEKMMVDGFGRPPRPQDYIFYVNSARNFETLFAQDRLWRIRGNGDVKVGVLADIPQPKVSVVDDYTIRLESERVPFFSSFAGQMGSAASQPRRIGDTASGGEFEGRIVDARDGEVWVVELRFRRPIKSDSYRFYWSDPRKPPVLAPQIYGGSER